MGNHQMRLTSAVSILAAALPRASCVTLLRRLHRFDSASCALLSGDHSMQLLEMALFLLKTGLQGLFDTAKSLQRAFQQQ